MFDEAEFQSIQDAYTVGALEIKISRLLNKRSLEMKDRDRVLTTLSPGTARLRAQRAKSHRMFSNIAYLSWASPAIIAAKS
jgi:hypothetical protein